MTQKSLQALKAADNALDRHHKGNSGKLRYPKLHWNIDKDLA
jgi:hypothetical protein